MTTDEQEIRDLIAVWLKASAAGDVERILLLMTEDTVFLRPGQPPMRGREAFAAAFKAGASQINLSADGNVREVEVAGHLAYCWNHLTLTFTPKAGGEPKKLSGDILTVFRKEADGRWRLFRDANLLT